MKIKSLISSKKIEIKENEGETKHQELIFNRTTKTKTNSVTEPITCKTHMKQITRLVKVTTIGFFH